MIPTERFLPVLERVTDLGGGRYKASCPTSAHPKGDRSAGLRVTETDDGRVLLHCFAGCSAEDIVGAVGLALSDLFPDKPDRQKRTHRISPRDALKACHHEIMVMRVGVARLKNLTPEEVARVEEAGQNVEQILRRAL